MISFEQWYELARLTDKGDKGREMAEELFVKLFPNLQYYYAGKRRYSFQEGNYSLHCLGMLYNSGLVNIQKKYITTISFPAIYTNIQIIEINVPGISTIRVGLDTFFDTNDPGENGKIIAHGNIGG